MLFYVKFLASGTILLSISSTSALAYIDPGTGSMILQAVIGAVVAGGVLIKVYYHKIMSFFRKKPDGSETDTPKD